MKARIQEDKCLDKIIKETTMYMQNLEPLDLPDVRVSVGVDVGLNIGFHVGAVIGMEVATGYDLKILIKFSSKYPSTSYETDTREGQIGHVWSRQ